MTSRERHPVRGGQSLTLLRPKRWITPEITLPDAEVYYMGKDFTAGFISLLGVNQLYLYFSLSDYRNSITSGVAEMDGAMLFGDFQGSSITFGKFCFTGKLT